MSDVYNRIKELSRNIGELVLDESQVVVRFLGCTCDDEDCYYRFFELGKGITLCSMVAGMILLKGKLDDKDYERLDGMWRIKFQQMYGVAESEESAKGGFL